jgi:hypothetical protein
LFLAKILSACDFNTIRRCVPQANYDRNLWPGKPFGFAEWNAPSYGQGSRIGGIKNINHVGVAVDNFDESQLGLKILF